MSQGLLDAIADAMRNAGASPQVMGAEQGERAGKGDATPSRPRYDTGSETPDNSLRYDLRVRLIDASNGNIDPLSDISPIRSLIE